jgi:hypothetical protein
MIHYFLHTKEGDLSDTSELNKATKAHSIWKMRLKDAVDSGKSEFFPY